MTVENFKKEVRQAAAYLAEHGIEVPHTRLLEAMSRAFGERNWSTFKAQLEKAEGAANVAAPAASAVSGMTDAKFVAHGGARCPVCGSDDVEGETVQADGPNAWDESRCNSCHSTWNTAYMVCGYFDLEVGDLAPSQSAELREDVIEALVEDVRERARKYEFSVSSLRRAQEMAQDSAEVLDLDATQEEIDEAAKRLY